MICKIFLLGLAGLALAGEPGVFDNYFDDTIKEVDISLDVAIKGCLQNGDTFADKVRKAYGDCFGSTDYAFADLAANEGGKDSDNDGLPDSFEGNEKCFYKKIGWVDGAGNLSPDAIKGDLAGLGSGEKAEFDDNIDKCASWNGDFSSRRKREVGENETEEEVSNVPSVMESGNSALGWLQAAVRKVRSANPEKRNQDKKSKGKKKKGKKNGAKKGGRKNQQRSKKRKGGRPGRGGRNNKKSKKRPNQQRSKKKKGGRPGGRNNKKPNKNGKNRKGGRKTRRNKKPKKDSRRNKKPKKESRRNKKPKKDSKRNKKPKKESKRNKKPKKDTKRNKKPKKESKKSGKKGGKNGGKNDGETAEKKTNRNNNGMAVSTYNKLWCFDLSLEQILEKCVENKIKN